MKLKCLHCNTVLDLDREADGGIKPFDCPACGSLNEEPFQFMVAVAPPSLPLEPKPQKLSPKLKRSLGLVIAGVSAVLIGFYLYAKWDNHRRIEEANRRMDEANRRKDEAFYAEVERDFEASRQQLEQIRRDDESGALTTEKANYFKAKVLKHMKEVRDLRDQYEPAHHSASH